MSHFSLIGSYKAGVIAVMRAIYEPIISCSSVIRNLPAIKWHVDAGLGRRGFNNSSLRSEGRGSICVAANAAVMCLTLFCHSGTVTPGFRRWSYGVAAPV